MLGRCRFLCGREAPALLEHRHVSHAQLGNPCKGARSYFLGPKSKTDTSSSTDRPCTRARARRRLRALQREITLKLQIGSSDSQSANPGSTIIVGIPTDPIPISMPFFGISLLGVSGIRRTTLDSSQYNPGTLHAESNVPGMSVRRRRRPGARGRERASAWWFPDTEARKLGRWRR